MLANVLASGHGRRSSVRGGLSVVDWGGLGAYPYTYLHGRVHKSCADKSIACLDLLETYAPYADSVGMLHVNPFDAHPNVLANKLVVEQILEVFGRVWAAAER